MTVELVPASTLDDERLAELFTAMYAGYWHPIELDAAGLRNMVETYDLDLHASVVARADGDVVGIGVLAVRADEGWVGGMGVVPERRGGGIGSRITSQLLANGRARGLHRIRLEVLEQNAPAIAIYRRLGFVDLRDVAVWSLDGPPDAEPAADSPLDETLAVLSRSSGEAPWQRSAATIARLREAGAPLTAARTTGGAAVYTLSGERAALQEIAAANGSDARSLLGAPFAAGASSLLFLNGPTGGVVAAELDAAGGTRVAVQHELAVAL